MTTSINQAIDMGTKVLPPVAGSTVNLGTVGATQVTTTTTTTNQGAEFGVEGPGLGATGAVGYGTTSIDVGKTGSVAPQMGVEGSGLGGTTAVGYGSTSFGQAQQIVSGMPIGVEGSAFPSVPVSTTTNVQGNQIASTISPSFLPDAFTSVQPGQILENQQNA